MEHVVSVAIVGAGIAGISAAVTLKREFKDKIELIIYEKSPSIGGTWRENIYPGCAADSAHLYSLSTSPNPNWSQTHVPQPEILAYLTDLVDKNNLRPYIHFNRTLTSAHWDPSTSRYIADIEDTLSGAKVVSTTHHVLITASGIMPRPRMPDVPGLERFEGKLFHSARWERDVDLRNKRVAVIGNGSSAAQLLPEIVKIKGIEVTQFFRRANWHSPCGSASISPSMQARFRGHPWTLQLFRWGLFLLHELFYLFVFGSSFLRSFTTKICKKHVLENAPQKYHDILTPDYPLGCRRVIFDVAYLQSLHLPNVKLVNKPVKRFTETGVITSDGQYCDFDVIIAATGFDTHVAPLQVRGNNRWTLQEYYDLRGGPEAYLGTMVPGFPNFFILGGPNTITGYMSYYFTVECQLNYIIPLLRRLGSTDVSSFEVTQKANDRYNRTLRKRFKDSVWNTLAARHYQDPGGSGKHIFLFPGSMILYWWWTRSTPNWRDLLIDGKEFTPRKMPRSTLTIFTALFLMISLVLVLVTLDKRRGGIW